MATSMTDLDQLAQIATPALYARAVSKGRWVLARHLAYLDRAITDTITGTGGIRRLLVMMPPRHGKSELCSHYLPSWYLGTFPHHRVILASYEADYAMRWGRKALATTQANGHLFGVEISATSAAAERWDLDGFDGGMETAGMGGALTGKGANLLIIDDPVKDWEQAMSERYRERAWDWYTSTAYTRLEPDGAIIVFHTRWHEEDLGGRLLTEMSQGGETWRVVKMPALAEAGDCLGRMPGEALWPSRFDEKALAQMQLTLGPRKWAALYGQSPTPAEGGMFKRDWFEIVTSAPRTFDVIVRAWDLAATEGDGDYTAGVLIGIRGESVWVLDVVRGQWSSGHRDDNISLCAMQDDTDYGQAVQIWLPQDPSSAGKQVAQISADKLKGYRVRYETVKGGKETRADSFAARCWAGEKSGNKVKVLQGPWTRAFLDEHCVFPNGSHDDQVDAAGDAYRKAAKPQKKFMVA